MGDYAKQKLRVLNLIDKFIDKGEFEADKISFLVMRSTGFSENFILTYIKRCIETSNAREENGLIMRSK